MQRAASGKRLKLILGITGASGSLYALHLIKQLEVLKDQLSDVSIVFSDCAKQVWNYELSGVPQEFSFPVFSNHDFFVPFASGSSAYDAMIVCPCSMGTLGRIASGVSSDLITRSADVMLKERRKLLLVTRETPLNLIHINNMKTITEAGGIILPASPSFYNRPETIEGLVNTVIERILQQIGLDFNSFRWGVSSK